MSQKYMYWAVQKNLVKGCCETLDCYCVSCELLSASIEVDSRDEWNWLNRQLMWVDKNRYYTLVLAIRPKSNEIIQQCLVALLIKKYLVLCRWSEEKR